MDRIDEERAAELAKALSELAKEQSEAFHRSAFIKMSPEETEVFDKRRERISELCSKLGKLRPKF
jgi:hypothetical protein